MWRSARHVFEGLRCYETKNGPAIFRVREHMQRMVNSAKIYRLQLPYTADELDRLSHRVSRGKDELTLQPREFRLLEYLMKHAGQVVTRTMLLENVWDYHFDPQTNVIDVHISRLRSKIDKGFERPLLHTIRGAGYMIRDGIR